MKIPYIKNGKVGYLDEVLFGFIDSYDNINLYADKPVSFIAIQYGFVNMWQKKEDGTWAEVE